MHASTVLVFVVVALGNLGCSSQLEPVALDGSTATNLSVRDDSDIPTSATVEVTAVEVTAVEVTAVAPSTSRSVPTPTTTTVVPGAPLPDVSPGFCAELAVHSGDLMSSVEQVLLDGDRSDGSTMRALLISSRDLLVWTAARVPVSLGSEVGALVGVYHNISSELKKLDPDVLTEARIRGVLFTSVFGSSSTDAVDLEVAAVRLAAFINRSCGPGYPLLTSLGDIFAIAQSDDELEAGLDDAGSYGLADDYGHAE